MGAASVCSATCDGTHGYTLTLPVATTKKVARVTNTAIGSKAGALSSRHVKRSIQHFLPRHERRPISHFSQNNANRRLNCPCSSHHSFVRIIHPTPHNEGISGYSAFRVRCRPLIVIYRPCSIPCIHYIHYSHSGFVDEPAMILFIVLAGDTT